MSRKLPEVRDENILRACARSLELGAKSTGVVGWYDHGYDSRKFSRDNTGGEVIIGSTVRGPFHRWLYISEGGGWIGDRPESVVDTEHDAAFIAHALNNVESIASAHIDAIQEIQKLRIEIKRLRVGVGYDK